MDKKYIVSLTSRAIRDLDGIYAYIAESLKERVTAEALIEEIEKQILSLDEFPYRCPERRVGAYANKGYRQLIVKNFTAVYRIDEEKKRVIVITVRYSRSQF